MQVYSDHSDEMLWQSRHRWNNWPLKSDIHSGILQCFWLLDLWGEILEKHMWCEWIRATNMFTQT